MGEIEKIREGLYVKKSFDGYRVVYPFRNDDGSFNWNNFLLGGNYWKLLKTLFIIFLILAVSYSYYHDTKSCRDLISNPCSFLPNITSYCTPTYTSPLNNFNLQIQNETT